MLPPILPVGTAVVLLREMQIAGVGAPVPAGTGGLVVRSPVDATYAYRVRLPGGEELSISRDGFEVLATYQSPGYAGSADVLARHDLQSCVALRVVIGSRAYGLEHGGSDTDRRGVHVPPARAHWSLSGVPEQLENEATQECYWEVGKFVHLALKANPNVLEVLYSPLVEHADEFGQQLLDARQMFLSKLIFQTFNGYAMSQFRKLEQDVRNQGSVKWKHAMHLVRLLIAGKTALESGVLPVRVQTNHAELLAIRDGKMAWADVDAMRLRLHQEFEAAYENTRLPERPDYRKANELLVGIRLAMAKRE
jgi:predicted nucleotidyltransferase